MRLIESSSEKKRTKGGIAAGFPPEPRPEAAEEK
jgi:hypothetical protein